MVGALRRTAESAGDLDSASAYAATVQTPINVGAKSPIPTPDLEASEAVCEVLRRYEEVSA